jgi:hypothetical protein
MAPDERDRRFDKALARHLRSAAPAGESARLAALPASQRGSCPDSETLAAYHERSLLPEELNSWKEHIVGCANCQNILAQLDATDEISLPAALREEVVRKGSEPVIAPRNVEAFPAAAAPGQSQRTAGAAPPKKSRRALLLRGARWQWLAPAGAIAAGLLVWIALHENQPLAPPSLKQVQMVTNQAPAPPTPSVSTTVGETAPPAKAAVRKPPSAVDEFAGANTRGASEAMKPSQTLEYQARVSPSKPLADKESMARKDTERDSSINLLRTENQADLDAKKLPEALRKKDESQSQAANLQAQIVQSQNAQTQNQYNYAQPRVPGPGALNQAETPKKAKATAAAAPVAPPPQPEVVGGVASSYNSSASLEVARAISNPRLISPPDSSVIWRAGRSGLIELSKDGGAFWSRQTSGVLADLLTGSAPSDKVCWIVGRVGAIVLTTDGGVHWVLISSPLSEDLGGIRATDERRATIWNARNTKNFETSDGGLTWKPVPNP